MVKGEKGFSGLKRQRSSRGRSLEAVLERLIPFLFPLRRIHLREPAFRGKTAGSVLSDTGEEIIKGTDTRSVPKRESTKDGIKGHFPEHTAPNSDGSYFQLQRKQVRTQHAGRKVGPEIKNKVTFLQNFGDLSSYFYKKVGNFFEIGSEGLIK